jgi:TfoX N-terminal domain
MAYDEELADRLRALLDEHGESPAEKRMFGGLGFMVAGNLCVAASSRGGLLARTDPAAAAELSALPHAETMVMRGREMPGWILVGGEGVAGEEELRAWVGRALEYTRTLPPKPA